MIAETMSLNLKNIDKSDWKLFQFKDIAKRVTENVKPEEAEVDIYIGLEHLDGNDIHIRRKGVPSDVKGVKLRCYPGDIIFGKRRAYQRKAAIVDFNGICSAHAFVFRAKEEVMLTEFFPFFLHSDEFMHRMVDISKGGLSPTINWGDLKHQEFLLPSINEQRQLAQLLWAMDEVIEKEKGVRDKLDVLFKSKIKFISYNEIRQNGLRKIKDICDIKDNLRKPLNSGQRNKMKGEIPYYGANGIVDFIDSYIFNEDLVLLAEDGGNFMEFYEKPIAYKIKGKSWVNNHAHVLSPKTNELSTDWLYYSLIHKNITKYIIGTTRLKLNKSELERIEIWVPEKQTQNKLEKEITRVYQAIKISDSKIHSSEQLLRSLIHQIF